MSLTFTPSATVDMSKERDWPASLGMLDWDSTGVLFTKRSLIEFLKYTGITVDPNFTNIGKLPRYAKFGKVTGGADEAIEDSAVQADSDLTAQKETVIQSRRMRTVPGDTHTDIFAYEDDGDALSHAPAKFVDAQPSSSTTAVTEPTVEEKIGINFSSGVKTRPVRENPGGNVSIANFWDPETPTEFKPTRRVRQGPGGHDSISEMF